MSAAGDNIYYIKTGEEDYTDFTVKWKGLSVLKIDKLAANGEPKNIFFQSWINSNMLDVYIPEKVCFEASDVELSFWINDFTDRTIDVVATHADFINYMTTQKVDIWSKYLNLENSYICVTAYEPTNVHVMRSPGANYIMGTITLKKVNSLNIPKNVL